MIKLFPDSRSRFLLHACLCLCLFSSLSTYGQEFETHCTLSFNDGWYSGRCDSDFFQGLAFQTQKTINEAEDFKNAKNTQLKLANTPVPAEVVWNEGTLVIKPGPPKIGWFKIKDLGSEAKNTFEVQLTFLDNLRPIDLEIINEAIALIEDEKNWNGNDKNRDCDAESGKYSLFCAMMQASLNITGEYNHRNYVLQRVRKEIMVAVPDYEWKHRFQEFNNMSKHKEIIDLLRKVQGQVKEELGQ